MRRFVFVAVLASATAAAGCASLGRAAFKEPVVSLKNFQVTGLGLQGGSVEVQLNVYNPNRFRLDATRLTYNLVLDSVNFGSGAIDQRFEVGENDSTVVRLPLSFTYAGVGEAGKQLLRTGTVNYRVVGDFTVGTPLGNFTRPYDRTGRFSTLSGSSR